MKRSLILIMLFATSSIVVFLGSSITLDRSKYNNDFVRIFPSHAADIKMIYKITPRRFHLAGLTNSGAFLQDRSGILIVDLKSFDTTRINLDIPFGAEVLLDSPFFFIHHGSEGWIKRGLISDCKIDSTFRYPSGFTAFQPISGNNAIVRTIDISERKTFLKGLSNSQSYRLRKQVDGLLCTDGLLQYSKKLNTLIYVYRYRNQFICFNRDLKVVRFGKTIDTTSVAKISVAEVDGKITMSKPPLSVNNDAKVSGDYLFIQSNLVSKNESADEQRDRKVIDVYNLTDDSYAFSFYIHNHESSRMESFLVTDRSLVAIFKDALILYDLPEKYLP